VAALRPASPQVIGAGIKCGGEGVQVGVHESLRVRRGVSNVEPGTHRHQRGANAGTDVVQGRSLVQQKGMVMAEPTDSLGRQLALTALTTEQFNLQSARMGTISEAGGRSTLYLGTLSSAVIAIAFVRQASELGGAFYLLVLTLLPPVFLLGVFTYLRLVQTSIEDMVYTVLSFGSASTSWAWILRRCRSSPRPTRRGSPSWNASAWCRLARCRRY
jgi:hypothetical protein